MPGVLVMVRSVTSWLTSGVFATIGAGTVELTSQALATVGVQWRMHSSTGAVARWSRGGSSAVVVRL